MKRHSRGSHSSASEKPVKKVRTLPVDEEDDDPVLLTLTTRCYKNETHDCSGKRPAKELYHGLLRAAEEACLEYLNGNDEIETEPEDWDGGDTAKEHREILSQLLEQIRQALVSIQKEHETGEEAIPFPVLHFRPILELLKSYDSSRRILDESLTSLESRTLAFAVKDTLNALENYAYGMVYGRPCLQDVFQACFRLNSSKNISLTCTEMKTCGDCDSIVDRETRCDSDITDAVVTGATILIAASSLRTGDELNQAIDSPFNSLDNEQQAVSFLEATLSPGQEIDLAVVGRSIDGWRSYAGEDDLERFINDIQVPTSIQPDSDVLTATLVIGLVREKEREASSSARSLYERTRSKIGDLEKIAGRIGRARCFNTYCRNKPALTSETSANSMT